MVCARRAGDGIHLAQGSYGFRSSQVRQPLQLIREVGGQCAFPEAVLGYEGRFEARPVNNNKLPISNIQS